MSDSPVINVAIKQSVVEEFLASCPPENYLVDVQIELKRALEQGLLAVGGTVPPQQPPSYGPLA
jgi:hypothetical protein